MAADVGMRVGFPLKRSGFCAFQSSISNSRRVPNPVAPVESATDSSRSTIIGRPQMSMCTHGMPPTNSSRNSAAVIEPAFTPPRFLMSATSESRSAQAMIEGQLPHGLVGALRGGLHLFDQLRVVAHDRSVQLPKGASRRR